ncbi:uncharacterized protein LOC144094208 isoform X2 [Amblyomma americanum]
MNASGHRLQRTPAATGLTASAVPRQEIMERDFPGGGGESWITAEREAILARSVSLAA